MKMNRKRIIFIFFLLLSLGALAAGVYLVQKRQEIRKEAAPATSIYFKPETKEVKAGEAIELEVWVNTGGNSLYSIFLEINYDPSLMTDPYIRFTSLLPDVLRGVDASQTGKVTASAGTGFSDGVANPPISGTQKIATVSFFRLRETSGTQISFGPQTAAYTGTGTDIGVNLIKSTTPATIIVLAPTPTPRPTATPTPRPTSTPTPRPTLTPSPTSTPTPGATPTLRPTATPTPRPTNTPTPRPIPTSTPTPEPTPTPRPPISAPTLEPTPTPQADRGNFIFTVLLEGMVDKPPVLEFKVDILKDEEKTSQLVQATHYDGGVYKGAIFNLEPGTYDFVIKPPRHLSGKFSQVNISKGETYSAELAGILLAGDICGPTGKSNNLIDIFDITLIVEEFDQVNSPADVDYDGKVTVFDITYVVGNFDKKGEE